ncbi:MAG: segregation and condensation protein [Patescibacteria group bacterium]|jgi:segregation and condensation protein B|nr:segregation and condensation protein [Patescibacteria group bacterium]
MKNNISQQIESLLFATADPQAFKSLSSRLGVSVEEIKEAVLVLENSLEGHAMMIVREGEEIVMVTRPEHSALIETIRKEELSKELSKSSAETLSIVAYCDGVSKAQIEFIRGVNATYAIRALSMRGLIEARGGGRSILYYPTLQMLEHFGVSKVEELPEHTATSEKIKKLLNQEESQ